MATYRCLASGNTVTFTQPHDIESMKGHTGYVRIDEDAPPAAESQRVNLPFIAPQPVARPRGRPRKVPTQ